MYGKEAFYAVKHQHEKFFFIFFKHKASWWWNLLLKKRSVAKRLVNAQKLRENSAKLCFQYLVNPWWVFKTSCTERNILDSWIYLIHLVLDPNWREIYTYLIRCIFEWLRVGISDSCFTEAGSSIEFSATCAFLLDGVPHHTVGAGKHSDLSSFRLQNVGISKNDSLEEQN